MMAVMRINKTRDYTIMSNAHFKEKEMTLKAKGLLSLMLSLPDDWDYSIAGLCAICVEKESAIKSTLDELRAFGYLVITKKYPNETESGRIEYIYDIYETPQKQAEEKQGIENQGVECQEVENPRQLNTNVSNTNTLNTNKSKTKNNNIDEHFEKLWKMLKSTPYDRKSKVTKKRKKELFDMGAERTEKAISVYLQTQNPNYYHKRDNFLNEIIDNYLDKEASHFLTSPNPQSKTYGANGIAINKTSNDLDGVFQ